MFKLLSNTTNSKIIFDESLYKMSIIPFYQIKQIRTQLITPFEQVDLNDDRVKEMIAVYIKKPTFFKSQCLITIGFIKDEPDKQYIIDGQHRLKMAEELHEKLGINDIIIISYIKCNGPCELTLLFDSLNKTSSKYVLKDAPMYINELYKGLQKKLKEMESLTFINSFIPLSSSSANNIKTIKGFCDELYNNNFIKINKTDTTFQFIFGNQEFNVDDIDIDVIVDIIYQYLIKKEREFFRICYIDDKSIGYHNHTKFSLNEKKSVENESCMFIKANNFLDWIMDNRKKAIHHSNKYTKQKKLMIWKNIYNSSEEVSCIIPYCKKNINKQNNNEWGLVNIISSSNGGDIMDYSNKTILCMQCSNEICENNLDDFINDKIKSNIIKKYFNEDIIKCQCVDQNCRFDITKDDFIIKQSHTKKYIPISKLCETK